MKATSKPSDFNQFRLTVYSASATELDLEQYLDYYDELLKILFWNPDVDTPMALARQQSNPSGVVLRGGFNDK